ncbi:hypothetical protein FSP39_004160 [Pinctada imbricata]|uniref:Uncharacterized protein n=1 Tax=Pinctada imbricata TaxID=66713 RepID=A0AA88XPR2_PINIB|nr:hypothetical protein FSP39_004160 [Pinctada imbricata]
MTTAKWNCLYSCFMKKYVIPTIVLLGLVLVCALYTLYGSGHSNFVLKHNISRQVQQVFEHIARKNIWGGGNETRSGLGSLLASTVSLRECLGKWIKEYNISSIVDIPCGDANWQRFVPGMDSVRYKGFDISTYVVDRARAKNPVKNMAFGLMDITSQIPPKADLIILRDFIQHLPLKLGKRALDNARISGAKWIGVSSYPLSSNRDIKIGDYYANNVQISPFNVKNVVEICDNYSGGEKKGHPGSKFLLIRNK